MAKTPYVMQKRFGELTPSKIGVVGSFADGNPQTSTDLADIQDSARFSEGLTRILVNGASPTVEDFNGILYLLTSQIRRMQRTGLGEWLSSLVYSEGDVITFEGNAFISLADDNFLNSPSDYTAGFWHLLGNKTYFYESPTGVSKAVSNSVPTFDMSDLGFASDNITLNQGASEINISVPLKINSSATAGVYSVRMRVENPGGATIEEQFNTFYTGTGGMEIDCRFSFLRGANSPFNITPKFAILFPGTFSGSVGGYASARNPSASATRIR